MIPKGAGSTATLFAVIPKKKRAVLGLELAKQPGWFAGSKEDQR